MPDDTANMKNTPLRGRGGIAFLAAFIMACGLGLIAYGLHGASLTALPMTIYISGVFLLCNFLIALLVLLNLMRISVWGVMGHILPLWFTLTVIAFLILLITRLDYSIVFFACGWVLGLGLLYGFAALVRRYSAPVFGVLAGVRLPPADNGTRHVPIGEDGKIPEGSLNPDGVPDGVIATAAQMDSGKYTALLAGFAVRGIPIIPAHVYTEQITGRVDLAHLDAPALMQMRPWRRYALLKRLSDIAMALAGIAVFFPVMVILFIIIPLESPGPAVFIQERVGQGGRAFRLYKFRSMRAEDDSPAPNARFAAKDDARITRIGRFIRIWRLDELPQLFNVLTGDMSMIGPRPEQEALVDDLAAALPLYRFRHVIRPGITGWAQVMQGYADDVATTDVKLSYDFFYIRNLSPVMDFVIFFKTLKTILTGFGSR